MAKKKLTAIVKIQIPAGKATPAPPVGTALGPHGVAIMDFVKKWKQSEITVCWTTSTTTSMILNLIITMSMPSITLLKMAIATKKTNTSFIDWLVILVFSSQMVKF